MANSAFNHSPTIVVPGSSTNTALVKWSGTGADTFLDSTILVGATTMGLAADTDLLTFGNGTLAITGAVTGVTALTASGAVTGGTLAGTVSTATQGSITSAANLATVGTIGTGVWNGTAIITTYGGTGLASYTAGDMFYYASGTTLTKLAKGTADQVLTMNDGATAPGWEDAAGGGVDTTGSPASPQIAYFSDSDTLQTNSTLTWHSGNHSLRMSRAGNIQFDMVPTGGSSQAWALSARTDGTFRITNDSDGSIDLKIDGGGAITQARQPSFIAKLTTSQDNVTGNTILFRSDNAANSQWSIIENRGSGFANGKFTAPVAGLYQFNLVVNLEGLTSSNTYGNLLFYTDGPVGNISMTSDNFWAQSYTGSGNLLIRWSMLVELDANDYGYFGGYVYYGSQVVDLRPGTFFSGHLVA